MNYKVFTILIMTLFISKTNSLKRNKRFVVYPRGGGFKIVIGIAMPIKITPKQTVAIGWNVQFQYPAPTNSSMLHNYPPIITKRSVDQEISDRALFYKGVEDFFDSYEIKSGHDCLLRSICENALHPTYHEANGLYGHLIHILLTPNYELDEPDTLWIRSIWKPTKPVNLEWTALHYTQIANLLIT